MVFTASTAIQIIALNQTFFNQYLNVNHYCSENSKVLNILLLSMVRSLAKYDILGIGNPVFDVIETPYVKTDGRVLSGCSINAVLAVGKLGGKGLVIGSIAEDFRDIAIKKLSQYGVDAFFFQSKETGGFHLRYIGERMNDRILKLIGRADPINVNMIEQSYYEYSRTLLIGPILDELDVSGSIDLINKARDLNRSIIVLVDPQGYIRRIQNGSIRRVPNKEVLDLIRFVDIFKPNEHEAKVIFGSQDPVIIAKKIRKLGAKIGIVTLAERGSIISTEEGTYIIPAFRTTERDPTGCGDVYGGAFLYYYIKSEDPVESAVFASAAASYMVEDSGPDFRLNKKMVLERFNVLIDEIEKVL